MDIISELSEDIPFMKEYREGDAARSYEFPGKNGPLVAVHGAFGGWMKDGLRHFMKANDVAGKLVFWGPLTDSLETYLPFLDAEVAKYEKPLILGYSLGGILSILYAERYKAWDRIDKIITIASPFEGVTPLLGFLGDSIREMAPRGLLLKEILNITPPKDKILSLTPMNDKFTDPKKLKLDWVSAILGAQSHGDIQNHHEWLDPILKAELGIK